MKKLLFTLTFAAGLASLNAQKMKQKDIPVAVQKSFQKQFPNVKDAKWEKEKENYEAAFKSNNTEMSIVINPSGIILETENKINRNALSTTIKNYITKNFPNQKIKEAAKITNAKGNITYEAEVNGKDLIFDNKGTFLKEVKD